jgi:hypothetical protein
MVEGAKSDAVTAIDAPSGTFESENAPVSSVVVESIDFDDTVTSTRAPTTEVRWTVLTT